MTVADDELRRAKRGGILAARRGLPATVCPYPLDQGDHERALAHVWLSAYLGETPPGERAVDYDG